MRQIAEIIPVEPDKVMLDWGMSFSCDIRRPFVVRQRGVLYCVRAERSVFMKDLLLLDKDVLKTVISAVQEFSLYLTIALAAVLLVTLVVVYLKNKDAFELCKKFVVGVAVGYSVTLISVLLCLQIARLSVKGEIDGAFWLFVGFFVVLLVLLLLESPIKKRFTTVRKYYDAAAFSVVAIYAVILVITVRGADGYGNYLPQESILYYVLSAVLIAAVIALAFIFDRKTEVNETKNLAYAGVCIALSFALSYVKLFSMPMGGSVTFASMLPLMFYAYMFGAKRGVFAGLIYGVLQFIQSPQPYQWMQILLDYPVAFAALGLAGIASEFKFLKGNTIVEVIVGMTIAALFRYFAHVTSGYFVFYTWSTMDNPLLYSVLYNSFIFVDLAIDVVAAALILSSKSMRNAVTRVNGLKKTEQER